MMRSPGRTATFPIAVGRDRRAQHHRRRGRHPQALGDGRLDERPVGGEPRHASPSRSRIAASRGRYDTIVSVPVSTNAPTAPSASLSSRPERAHPARHRRLVAGDTRVPRARPSSARMPRATASWRGVSRGRASVTKPVTAETRANRSSSTTSRSRPTSRLITAEALRRACATRSTALAAGQRVGELARRGAERVRDERVDERRGEQRPELAAQREVVGALHVEQHARDRAPGVHRSLGAPGPFLREARGVHQRRPQQRGVGHHDTQARDAAHRCRGSPTAAGRRPGARRAARAPRYAARARPGRAGSRCRRSGYSTRRSPDVHVLGPVGVVLVPEQGVAAAPRPAPDATSPARRRRRGARSRRSAAAPR